ncbi:Tpc2 [Drosophila busckii]|uniref:Tpc2 n=1 Tax=Drosophila busckii TaxID=30019 RepID=A0A0M4EGC3_DROBS|nr:mitochondrial thiamine pyrophosphate carrier [Drosophila busckii]ALC41435.1 Tpc2 [Drosophila busckii]
MTTKKRNSTHVQTLQAIGGGLAGCITRFFAQPFDVLKIRFQLQVEPLRKGERWSKYVGFWHAVTTIFREEGLRGFWKGHTAGQVMSVTYAIVQFWSYEQFHAAATNYDYYENHRNRVIFICGGLAGCMGTIASQPFDVIRTRVVAADPHSRSGRLRPLSGVARVYRREGIRGVTGGLWLTLMQIFPLVGTNFLVYKFFNRLVVKAQEYWTEKPNPEGIINGAFLFMNGALAGMISKMLIYPADLIKKRLQLAPIHHDRQTFGKNPKCNTFSLCVRSLIRKEGIKGFYKGMLPTLYKSGVVTAFYFTIYDFYSRTVVTPVKRREQEEGRRL